MNYYQLYVENSKKIFTYKSDEEYNIGDWCIINFANREKTGLILSEIKQEDIKFDIEKVKNIEKIAPVATIPYEIIQLLKWLKDYYLSDYDSVIKAAYPGTLKLNYSEKLVYQEEFLEDEEFSNYMKKKKEVTLATVKKKFAIEVIEKAVKKKAVSIEKKLIMNSKSHNKEEKETEILKDEVTLTENQEKAVGIIEESDKQMFLIKGITGSGKTELYIRLIKNAIVENKGSIFLVPEISLTPQMIERLEKQFSNSIAILHSKLTNQEKRKEWLSIRNGTKKIVIGARSAIFAPVNNLKYIIIDEEHENTYKQDNNPRYHVKNVAIKRALISEQDKIKVILGSATPSFESYNQAQNGDLQLIELNERYNGAKIPKYQVVDLSEVDTTSNFSKELLQEMANVLRKKEQIMLVLNRKAFSTFVKCKDCGHIYTCPNCSITLNHYKYDNKLKCNYCGYEKKYVKTCEKCGSSKLIHVGSGTEKVEYELKTLFPDARIVRIDSETVKTKQDYENIYYDFKNKKYDIMLGTQIIAKGFHFPEVTLVGIINADIILNFPDFRAGEKTYQLLLQASGRSGRGEKEGKVIIQTFDKENEVITKTVESDYKGYYNNQLQLRKIFNYPPFGRLINIIVSSEDENTLQQQAEIFYSMLIQNLAYKDNDNNLKQMITKPFKAPLYKINSRYRYQIFIKSDRKNIVKIKNSIKSVMADYKEKGIRISVDVDPVNLM